MTMKKRILAVLVCAVMAASLAGCASKNEGNFEDILSAIGGGMSTSSDGARSSSKSSGKSSTSSTSSKSSSTSSVESSSSSSESSSTSSEESKPEESKPVQVDWSTVPIVDEMDLDYQIIESDEIVYRIYSDLFRDEIKEMAAGGAVLVTKYFGEAEYINLPDQIEGKSCIFFSDVYWGENAKAIRFSEGCAWPIGKLYLSSGREYDADVGRGSNIVRADVPDSWRYIGGFSGMPKLEQINIPKETRRIWEKAFSGTALKSVTLPENLEYIQNNAFSGCSSLESINFPEKYENTCLIQAGVFNNCTSLKSVKIPEGVTFQFERNSYGSVFFGCKALEKVILPSTVTGIGNYTFYGCSSLTDVTLLSVLKNIGTDAFYNCTSLRKVDIPDNVTYIGNGAFSGCSDVEINYKGKTYNEKNVEKLYDRDLSTM